MTSTDFAQNENLVKHWKETIDKNETVQLVLQAMDESSPMYQEIPELAKETAEAKYWFTKGYVFYHRTLKDLSRLPNKSNSLKPTYARE